MASETIQCPPCQGTGQAWVISPTECPLCRGIGQVKVDNQALRCVRCRGTGRQNVVEQKLCTTCGGYAHLPSDAIQASESHGPLVFFVESGKPHTAHQEVASLFGRLRGEVRACDPYYGSGTLSRLHEMRRCDRLLFLTKTPDSHERTFLDKRLQEYRLEHPGVEFRRYRGAELHDRFVLTGNELILLGHGLKDIGTKDSFVVRIDRQLAGDLIDCVRASFDEKWHNADRLP